MGNLRFVKGYIEFLNKAGIEPNSIDIVISNCVINLSPDKPRVLKEVYNVLRDGGELFFSDVYCSRRLPSHIRNHEVLLGECLGGALYIEDFKRFVIRLDLPIHVNYLYPLLIFKMKHCLSYSAKQSFIVLHTVALSYHN